MKIKINITIIICFILLGSTAHAQKTLQKYSKKEINDLIKKVEANFDSLDYHQDLLKAFAEDNSNLLVQYDKWIEKYPERINIPLGIGLALNKSYDANASKYLLRVVALDSTITEAWGALWSDAERWGDKSKSKYYLQKAYESNVNNPDYAFYYSNSLKDVDENLYKANALKVANKFKTSERGAQSLYWLANNIKDKSFKELVYEKSLRDFSPKDFRWSQSTMSAYFNYLVQENEYEKAKSLSQEMDNLLDDETWKNNLYTLEQFIEIENLLTQNNGQEALRKLNNLNVSRYSPFFNKLPTMKAECYRISNESGKGYDLLLDTYRKTPSVALKESIFQIAKDLSKTEKHVQKDIYNKLVENKVLATSFDLKNYEGSSTKLEDFRGKVVLLTYWYPGCGPCRAEFPYFQNVVNQFSQDQLAYVGINIVSKQNDYVLPFMRSTGYTFYPLEDIDGREKGNLDNRNAAPINFLIDKSGNLIYSNFRTDDNNERDLELMIHDLLNI